MKYLIFALTTTFLLGGVASAENPNGAIAKSRLIEGLKLIRDNKFDEWATRYCSTEKLCFDDSSKKSLRIYNFPAMQRRMKNCIKSDGTITVPRYDEISKTEFKFFVQCEEYTGPVPFRLGMEDGIWKFLSL